MRRSDVQYNHCYCEENVYKFVEKFVLAAEVDRRKRASGLLTDCVVADDVLAPTLLVTTINFDAAAAAFMSTYRDDPSSEKKNVWESQFPICTRDLAGLVASPAGASSDDPFVVWDYHVIALLRHKSVWYVVDLDTKIGQSLCPAPSEPLMAVRGDLYFRAALYPQAIHQKLTSINLRRAEFSAAKVLVRVVPALEFLTTFRSDRSHMLVKKGGGRVVSENLKSDDYVKPPPLYPPILEASPVVKIASGASSSVTELPADGIQCTALRADSSWRQQNNLASFINMTNTTHVPGAVMSRDAALRWVSGEG